MFLFKAPLCILKNLEALRNNFFVGGDLDERKLTWISWNKVMASKKDGGLGVSSFLALNRALLFNWVWQFHSSPNFFRVRVIKAIYGSKGLIRCCIPKNRHSAWLDTMKLVETMNSKGVSLLPSCKKNLGDGSLTMFCVAIWLGDTPFKS